jgi:pimeloyl-ACP methyl ester carboxylesterase
MTTFVLVGGAWIGSWAWKRVAADLRGRGHVVYPLSLTGLGERVHLARPEVDLETHITDVINLIEFEDLRDVALVGHSYSGSVVAGVADRIGDRLAHVIYCDTAPLDDGESMMDFMSSLGEQGETQKQVDAEGDGWLLPPPPFADLPMISTFAGLSDEDRALLSAKSVPQPFGTYTQKLSLKGDGQGSYERVIIACNDFRDLAGSGAPRFAQYIEPEWRVEHLETGHWPMLSQPRELSDTLDRIVAD